MPEPSIPVAILIQQLHRSDWTIHGNAARSLHWFGCEHSLAPLQGLVTDPEETVRIATAWAVSDLQKAISYRNQLGM